MFPTLAQILTVSSLLLPAVFSQTACNNSPDLCYRNYNNITHLGAHDSPFVRDETTGFSTSGNQFYNSTVQLDAGVRLLSAQVHEWTGNMSGTAPQEWHLCHSSCKLLDAGRLRDWLAEIKAWMDRNPNDVVTVLLVNADNASAEDLNAEYGAAGVVPYSYSPPSSAAQATWPTLNTLITANTRLLSFVANLDPAQNTVAPYLMDEFTFIFENPYDVSDASNFTCLPDRPGSVKGNTQAAVSAGLMPLVNHFLYSELLFNIEIPAVDSITVTNSPTQGPGTLGQRAVDCSQAYGKKPTFFLIDFFNVGPAINAIDALNGITPVGRKDVSPSVVEQTSDAAATVEGKSMMGLAIAFVGLVVAFEFC